MPCIPKSHLKTIGQGHAFFIGNGLKTPKALLRVLCVIERENLLAPGSPALAILPLRLRLLDMGTVPKHDLTEIESSLCADHLPRESFFDQFWDQAAVVNVGMGEKNEREIFRKVRSNVLISLLKGFASLI
jgi:hypothetical protein